MHRPARQGFVVLPSQLSEQSNFAQTQSHIHVCVVAPGSATVSTMWVLCDLRSVCQQMLLPCVCASGTLRICMCVHTYTHTECTHIHASQLPSASFSGPCRPASESSLHQPGKAQDLRTESFDCANHRLQKHQMARLEKILATAGPPDQCWVRSHPGFQQGPLAELVIGN